jgi:hypothetical protein
MWHTTFIQLPAENDKVNQTICRNTIMQSVFITIRYFRCYDTAPFFLAKVEDEIELNVNSIVNEIQTMLSGFLKSFEQPHAARKPDETTLER